MGFIGNTLYGVDSALPGAGFYSISTATGAASFINTLSVSAYGGTTYNGNFYGASADNPAIGFEATTAGNVTGTLPLGYAADGLVAYSSGYFYGSEYTGTTSDELHAINATTFAISDIGALGAQAYAGIIVGNTLYSTDGLNIYTYTVTPTSVSGILSTVAITGLNANTGDMLSALSAEASVVPEPSSIVMGGIAIVLAGLGYARRRFASA
jgi:hypothetical protein